MNYFIKTYGCQMNQNDSVIIEEVLNAHRMNRVIDSEQADLYIINTCSVRAHAEQRASGFISTLLKWKRKRASRIICVCGCMAQRLGHELSTRFPWIDILVGPDNYEKLPYYIKDVVRKQTKICDIDMTGELYCGIKTSKPNGVAAFVTVTRGCDNFCSFCVVPYLRGRARSRPFDDILNEVNSLVGNGVKEVTLLGQNVNAYCSEGVDFTALLEKINDVPGLARIRFLTSHPAFITDRVLKAVAELDKVCEYCHLPLQSGSDKILKLMNRQYSNKEYRDIVARARAVIPGLALSTDVIVGFPSETETDFEATKQLMTEIEFDTSYMFRYSPRKESAAYHLEPKVDLAIAQRRLDEIIALQNSMTRKKNEDLVGRRVEILVEGKSRDGRWLGRTKTNKSVIFAGTGKIGDLIWIEIEKISGWTLIGRLIENV